MLHLVFERALFQYDAENIQLKIKGKGQVEAHRLLDLAPHLRDVTV